MEKLLDAESPNRTNAINFDWRDKISFIVLAITILSYAIKEILVSICIRHLELLRENMWLLNVFHNVFHITSSVFVYSVIFLAFLAMSGIWRISYRDGIKKNFKVFIRVFVAPFYFAIHYIYSSFIQEELAKLNYSQQFEYLIIIVSGSFYSLLCIVFSSRGKKPESPDPEP